MTVKGQKSKLPVGSFLSQREGHTKIATPQLAQVMLQTVQALLSNEQIANKLNVEWIVEQFNRISHLAGAPDDFNIKLSPDASTLAEIRNLSGQLQQMAQQIQQGAAQQAGQELAKQVGPALQKQGEAIQETQQGALQAAQEISKLKQAFGALMAAISGQGQPQPGMVQPGPTPPPPPEPAPPPEMPSPPDHVPAQ